MKKAQIEFGESLMVVIILVFILIVGIVFYYRVSRGSLDRELAYREDIESIKLAKAVLAMPEVQCAATDGGTHCVDELKLKALEELLGPGSTNNVAKEYYGKLFGYATVKLYVVDEMSDPRYQPSTLYNDLPTGPKVSKTVQRIFTTLYDPVDRTQQLAYLDVTRYTKVAS